MTTFFCDHAPDAPIKERWKVTHTNEGRGRRHLLKLPSNEYVAPHLINMIRVSAGKADRNSGEVGAVVHVECSGSWFTVRFDDYEEAKGFVDVLASFRNEIVDPS